jgi:hypothetical protein
MLRPILRGVLALILAASAPIADAASVLREQRTLTVAGQQEVWRLVWAAKPKTVCSADEIIMAMTCPCTGWAYGEYGDLALVRIREGREIERMALKSLFGRFDYPEAEKVEGSAYLQRKPFKYGDFARSEKGDRRLAAEIERRPATRIMNLADYDADGRATEFLMQVGTEPCGKTQFVALGVTASDPHLHALTSAAHPERPLIMPLHVWRALLSGHGRRRTLPTWECGDHGADESTRYVVSAKAGRIRLKVRSYGCVDDLKPGKLLSEADG